MSLSHLTDMPDGHGAHGIRWCLSMFVYVLALSGKYASCLLRPSESRFSSLCPERVPNVFVFTPALALYICIYFINIEHY